MKFNNVFEFLSQLEILGIRVYLNDNKLKVKGDKTNITDGILKEIKLHKNEIISFLDSKSIKRQKIKILPFKRDMDPPLSFAQERLWFIDQYEHNSSYNLPGAVKLIGKLDIKVLEKTFSEIIRRHEVLRTNIITINNVASQHIHKESKFELKIVDQSHLSDEAANQKNQELIEIESQKPFDLVNDSLIRAVLYKINDEEHTLFLNKHHIISDGWSLSVFFKEISILYKAFSENKPSPLPELEIQYADYAVWQREHIEGEVLNKQSEHWKNKLSGTAILELPTDKTRPGEQTFNGNNLYFHLDKDISEKLNAFSKENDVTLFMALLSVFKVLLNKYTGQDDICVGSPIANRTRSEIEPLIGIFVNTLALRSDLSGDISFVDLVKQVKQTTLDAYSNQDIPFEKVVDIVQPERNLSYSPLFQVMLVLQNNPANELSFGDLVLKPVEIEQAVSKFDLTLNFTETAEGLVGGIEYSTDLFEKDRIERMIGHFNVLTRSIISNPTVNISEFEFLTSEEKHKLLVEWNDTEVDYPKDKCIHKLFEEQVEKTPNNVAVVLQKEELTYSELNERANKLGHYLQKKGVKEETLVGICVDRSLDMIVGILGILKAGGAYVPIDPTYPKDRISFMLKNSECPILLTQELLKLTEDNNVEAICLDKENVVLELEKESGNNVTSNVQLNNLSYVIYTSGSTGQPKGVLIEHKNVVRLFFNDKFQFNFSEEDVWTLFHSYCFDFSVWEMYGALLFGAKLVVVPKESTIDTEQFCQLLESHEVTVLNLTPSAFYNLSDEVERKKTSLSIRYVIFGGEALTPSKLRFWHDNYADSKLINMYGITETTVHVTYKEITDLEINNNICNIGKPIPTLSAYILDENKNLLPVGIPGELCVTGTGVGRGYLNNDILSDEKFQDNPFVLGEKIYMSGDSAFVNELGELIYCGRIDNQVKIRGFRIELGEIENTLLKHKEISTTAVIAKEKNKSENELVAYYVSDQQIEIPEMRLFLAKTLPDYMLPSYFVHIDALPLTSNGKIDRKSLPDPNTNSVVTGAEYIAPQTDIEKKLVIIWQDVLELEQIGVTDNFFNIGGHSLKAVTLVSQINDSLNSNVKVYDIFSKPSIKELSFVINTGVGSDLINDLNNGLKIIEDKKRSIQDNPYFSAKLPSDYQDVYPLSKIQQGMVFFSLLRDDEPIYHDQFVYPIKFETFKLDLFHKSIEIISEQHPILRTSFNLNDFEEGYQIVHKTSRPEFLEFQDISASTKDKQKDVIKAFMRSDLEKKFMATGELLWRIKIFHLGETNYYIAFSCHHAVLDGWSVSRFVTEFSSVYNQLQSNDKVEVPVLKADYKKYVALDLSRSESEKIANYWKEYLKGYSRNRLPFNYSRKAINGQTGSVVVRRMLDDELLKALNYTSNKYNCSLKELLLSAHIYLLSILTGEKDLVTGVVTHDRPAIEDSEKVLGCFLNTVPIRFNVEKNIEKENLVSKVRDNLRGIKENELFLADIVNTIGDNNREGNPLFDTIFNYTDFTELNTNSQVGDVISSGEQFDIVGNEMTNTLFDLETQIAEDGIAMQIKYAPGYFYPENIETAYGLYLSILNVFVDDEKNVLEHSVILDNTEIKSFYSNFNNTKKDYSKEKTLSSLFEEQAIKTPENIALIIDNYKLTYKGLNERSNKLGHYLVEQGVTSGDFIGITATRGFDMIIGMLAILKSGGVYVPIDPEYPEERKEYLITNSGIGLVLQDKEYNLNCKKSITIEPAAYNKYPKDNLVINKQPHDLAYVIYTSGSTGNPKGVMIENHSIVNLINWVNTRFEINESDRLLFITSMCFDLSVYDIFGILSSGASVVIATKEQVRNPEEIMHLLKEKQITFWDSVPSTFNYILDSIHDKDWEYKQNDLRLVFMSGDWIPVNLPCKIKKFFPKAQQISLGGATEGTVWSNYYPIDLNKEHRNSIPYGKPIDNNSFYILDQNQNQVPNGVTGELYIGGVGVAAGYMNDKEKTEYSFVKDIFSDSGNYKMYRTGDYGRMLPDGNMEFIGRKDDQVKVRGYRVELGEIENVLLQHSSINSSVVIIKDFESGEKEIAAYYVSEKELKVAEIRTFLTKMLPDYMIPSYFIQIEAVPLTSNGKVDRDALPELDKNEISAVEYVAPTTETEKKLAFIWQEVLGVDKIGIHDNFFELGGHSLLATQVISQIRNEFNCKILLKVLFENATIISLSSQIIKAEKESAIEIIENAEWDNIKDYSKTFEI